MAFSWPCPRSAGIGTDPALEGVLRSPPPGKRRDQRRITRLKWLRGAGSVNPLRAKPLGVEPLRGEGEGSRLPRGTDVEEGDEILARVRLVVARIGRAEVAKRFGALVAFRPGHGGEWNVTRLDRADVRRECNAPDAPLIGDEGKSQA